VKVYRRVHKGPPLGLVSVPAHFSIADFHVYIMVVWVTVTGRGGP
jgi:hypothetical protein